MLKWKCLLGLSVFFCIGCAACWSALEELTVTVPNKSFRSSSSDENWRNGNADSRPIPPGETLELADLEGPGIVRHTWFTIAAKDKYYPESLVLRIYYDDREDPGVESPLGDFFGIGHGLRVAYQCEPYEISSNGRAYNCFWRMPFQNRFRMTVTNESDQPVRAFYYYVDWEKVPALPRHTAYFHAQYRQEKPCVSGKNYLILETKGRGHYVGTVLSVVHAEDGWFGEGDDFFFIDGEEEPTLRGTGTEDYFGDAWGFRLFQHRRHGLTVWEPRIGGLGTVYRWHTDDPIRFEKSLRVEIEHKGARIGADGKVVDGFTERADDYASVAFWYQEGIPPRFAELPPLGERMRKRVVIEAEDYLDRVESVSGEVRFQKGGRWSGEKHLFFLGRQEGSVLRVPFETHETFKHVLVVLGLTKSWDYGTYEIRLDESEESKTVNLYSPDTTVENISLGVRDLGAGKHLLEFRCVGSDGKSKLLGTDRPGFYFGIDNIELREIPPAPEKN